MKVTVFRKEHFNAAHRLNNSAWSPEKNQAVFGKCNNPNYQFFSIPLLQCREISYKLDDETVYKNYVYIDSWCEEGEILEEVHQRAEPPTELYIEIPKDNGNTL